ncbi:MAG: hypothetical protein MI922_26625 [Bacteroidales bacterium]|nr:hypothetical protein [Bacteroidales bacterium]
MLLLIPAIALITLALRLDNIIDTFSLTLLEMGVFILAGISFLALVTNHWTGITAEYKKRGKLRFESDKIIINENSYCLNQLSDILLEINSYKGYQNNYRTLATILSDEDGVDNKISFIDANGITVQVNFYIESKKKFKKIPQIIEKWYDSGIEFEEFAFGKKSFLTNTNMKYNEIKDFKAKYNIED